MKNGHNTFSTLSLGTRSDAESWEQGCRSLGYTKVTSIMTPIPTMDQVESFFREPAGMRFMGGHFSGSLYNHSGVDISFYDKLVEVTIGKKTKDFKVNSHPQNIGSVILFGGCSVFSYPYSIKNLRSLFPYASVLGTTTGTSYSVVKNIIRNSSADDDFFSLMEKTGKSHAYLAWLQAALNRHKEDGIADNYVPELDDFRAIDVSGELFAIKNKEIVSNGIIF